MSAMRLLRGAARRSGLADVARAILKAPQDAPRLHVARPPSNPSRYLAIAVIFKNETPYLAEWLEFHRLVGVEHVYLYDNGSTDNPTEVLAPYLKEGFVTLIPWALPWYLGGTTAQYVAFAHALLNFGHDWRWIAFIDLDEFLFPVEGNSLPALLRDYEELPAIAVFWTMFGFSGNEKRPEGLVIENYTMRAPFPTYAMPKSIVNPGEVVAVSRAHLFDLTIGPSRAFTETRQLFWKDAGLHGPRESNVLRLNHYFTRSREEFTAKAALTKARGAERHWQKLYKISEMIEADAHYDATILRFVPALKSRLA